MYVWQLPNKYKESATKRLWVVACNNVYRLPNFAMHSQECKCLITSGYLSTSGPQPRRRQPGNCPPPKFSKTCSVLGTATSYKPFFPLHENSKTRSDNHFGAPKISAGCGPGLPSSSHRFDSKQFVWI